MRLGVLADVHGNAASLRTAIDLVGPQVDGWLFAGDAFSDHRFSNEVVEELRDCGAVSVLGNHEMAVLGPNGRRVREAPHVRASNVAYVEELPIQVRLRIGTCDLLMVHGSPFEPFGDYLVPSSPRFERLREVEADVLVLGHTHVPFVERRGRTLIVNPGSLGQPGRPDAPMTASCMVLDLSEPAAELVEFPLPAP